MTETDFGLSRLSGVIQAVDLEIPMGQKGHTGPELMSQLRMKPDFCGRTGMSILG
jgi:hypothetical protein